MTNRIIQAVRRFNRFYTKQMGILDSAFLDSPYTLSEVRVMYEVAHGNNVTAKRIVSQLGLAAAGVYGLAIGAIGTASRPISAAKAGSMGFSGVDSSTPAVTARTTATTPDSTRAALR